MEWIVTNPPWSLARRFLQHAYEVADNVVFLIPLNHIVGLRVRIADMERAEFGVKEILLCATPPPPWPPSGFQLAAIHLRRGCRGAIAWGRLEEHGAETDTEQESAAVAIRANAHVLRASAFAIPLKAESVQVVVTSPPYYLLRKYPGGTDNDLGREKTIELYVEHLVLAMREIWRVLKDHGVVFLNLGDTYHGSGRGSGKNGTNDMKMNPNCSGTPLRGQGKAKCLCLIPQRAAIALSDDGWIVRNDVIWQKPNCTPDSVDDRCTCSYEHVLMLTKSENYYWNTEAAREPSVSWEKGSLGGGHTPSKKDGKMKSWTMRHGNKVGSSKTEKLSPPIGNVKHQALGKPTLVGHRTAMGPTRHLRDVWTINTHPHKEKHIAMFPEALVERCVRLGSRPGDVVLDCFAGSGTTGVVAKKVGRNAILLDISDEYCRLMTGRLSQQSEEFGPLSATENIARESSAGPLLDFQPGAPPQRTQTLVVNSEFVEWARAYSGPKFHACLSDPAYGYHFMGAEWDDPKRMTKNQVIRYLPSGQRMTTVKENIEFQNSVRQWGEAMLPLLYPGALVMMFAGSRMWHRLASGMEDAGFEMFDTVMWLQAQGFPKAMDIGKMIDKKMGNEREIVGRNRNSREGCDTSNTLFNSGTVGKTAFISRGESGWDGYKTPALKPAWEAILCFGAPRQGMTYAEVALNFGTGALNVDGGRMAAHAKKWDRPKGGIWRASEQGDQRYMDNPRGRYPANVILDEEAAKVMGDASRYFFCPKASKWEREAGCDDLVATMSGMSSGARAHGEGYDRGQGIGLNRVIPRKNNHPCVKPLALCRHLATLLLPPSCVTPRRLLVPFCGSGSEMIGGVQAGWNEIVGVEKNPHYCDIAEARLQYWREKAA